jgi:uncharacterized protein
MRRLPVLLCAALVLIGAAFPTTRGGAGWPSPRGFVNDFASVLADDARRRLEERLAAYERETGNEIAVAIFPSLRGQTIESLAVNLFEEWGIGKRNRNNGILILLAIQDRAVRIEVGYGLEGKVPDAQAGRIIREAIVPAFRQQRYADGLDAAIDELIRLIGAGPGVSAPTAPGAARVEPSDAPFGRLGPLLIIAALVVIGIMVYNAYGRARCPRCGTVMRVANRQRIRTRRGVREALLYVCPRSHYRELRESPAWEPAGWGTAGPWTTGGGGFSGSGGSGGFGGFGGGSSGGGGASGRW